MSRVPSEVIYVEDELGIVLFNLSDAELRLVKKACDALLAMDYNSRLNTFSFEDEQRSDEDDYHEFEHSEDM